MRLIREKLYEDNQIIDYINFTEDSDPIADMGIGAEEKIKKWLGDMNIRSYRLTKRNSINVYNVVDLSKQDIKNFPEYIKFNHIVGGFHCEETGLTTLRGCPYSVTGSFLVRRNNLKSLKYGPMIIKGMYSVSYNELESLEDIASYIGGSLFVSHNNLKTLENVPNIIKGDFCIHNNPIETLEYFPKIVEGNLTFTPSDVLTIYEIKKICDVKGNIIEYINK